VIRLTDDVEWWGEEVPLDDIFARMQKSLKEFGVAAARFKVMLLSMQADGVGMNRHDDSLGFCNLPQQVFLLKVVQAQRRGRLLGQPPSPLLNSNAVQTAGNTTTAASHCMLLANLGCQYGATLTAHHVRAFTPQAVAELRCIVACIAAFSGNLWARVGLRVGNPEVVVFQSHRHCQWPSSSTAYAIRIVSWTSAGRAIANQTIADLNDDGSVNVLAADLNYIPGMAAGPFGFVFLAAPKPSVVRPTRSWMVGGGRLASRGAGPDVTCESTHQQKSKGCEEMGVARCLAALSVVLPHAKPPPKA